MEFKGYKIRKSGKELFRIYDSSGIATTLPRAKSIEAAQALILSQGRVMTRKEHSLVYGSDATNPPTLQQEKSEGLVRTGQVEGFI